MSPAGCASSASRSVSSRRCCVNVPVGPPDARRLRARDGVGMRADRDAGSGESARVDGELGRACSSRYLSLYWSWQPRHAALTRVEALRRARRSRRPCAIDDPVRVARPARTSAVLSSAVASGVEVARRAIAADGVRLHPGLERAVGQRLRRRRSAPPSRRGRGRASQARPRSRVALASTAGRGRRTPTPASASARRRCRDAAAAPESRRRRGRSRRARRRRGCARPSSTRSRAAPATRRATSLDAHASATIASAQR